MVQVGSVGRNSTSTHHIIGRWHLKWNTPTTIPLTISLFAYRVDRNARILCHPPTKAYRIIAAVRHVSYKWMCLNAAIIRYIFKTQKDYSTYKPKYILWTYSQQNIDKNMWGCQVSRPGLQYLEIEVSKIMMPIKTGNFIENPLTFLHIAFPKMPPGAFFIEPKTEEKWKFKAEK